MLIYLIIIKFLFLYKLKKLKNFINFSNIINSIIDTKKIMYCFKLRHISLNIYI